MTQLGMEPIVASMKQDKTPVTLENWLALAYLTSDCHTATKPNLDNLIVHR